MKSDLFFKTYFSEISERLQELNAEKLEEIANAILEVSRNKKKLIVIGNGGSAAMASHVAVDFIKAGGIRAINFNEADLITCLANDYGHENWMSKAIEFYADSNDLVILISSSGKSPNILNAAIQSKNMGLTLVTLSGFEQENPLRQLGDINLWVDSISYNIVEMTHHIWLLAVLDYLIASGQAGRK
jgi:D-sedoheptulose 7-phosphate isomerase